MSASAAVMSHFAPVKPRSKVSLVKLIYTVSFILRLNL